MVTLPTDPVLVGLAVAGIVAVGAFLRAGTAFRAALARRRRVSRPIRDAIRSDGPDDFTGRVQPVTPEATFEAPFSGQQTVMSAYRIEERRRRRRRAYARGWVAVARGSICRPFVVEDEAVRVKVQPDGATVEPASERPELEIGAGDYLPTAVRLRLSVLTDAIDDLGSVLAQGETGVPRRYHEGRIGAGEAVHVRGCSPSGRLPGRSDVDAVFTAATDGEPVRVTARPGPDVVRSHLRTGIAYLLGGLAAVVPFLVAYLAYAGG